MWPAGIFVGKELHCCEALAEKASLCLVDPSVCVKSPLLVSLLFYKFYLLKFYNSLFSYSVSLTLFSIITGSAIYIPLLLQSRLFLVRIFSLTVLITCERYSCWLCLYQNPVLDSVLLCHIIQLLCVDENAQFHQTDDLTFI